MITAGDELWRTQGGNNNAYCQDNEVSWVDWSAIDAPGSPGASMLAFTQRALAVRRAAPALHQGEFFDGRAPSGRGDGIPDLVWFNETGEQMTMNDWFDADRHTVQMWVDGRDVRGHGPAGQPLVDESWLLVLHAGDRDVDVVLPAEPYGTAYSPVLDTGTDTGIPEDELAIAAGLPVTLPARTCWLLRAHRPAADGRDGPEPD
jgi:glycogen operon protein